MPHRTLEGSLAVFFATFFGIIVIIWFYFGVVGYAGGTAPELLYPFALAVAGLVTFLEAVSPGSVDNLVIPLVVAGFMHAMGV